MNYLAAVACILHLGGGSLAPRVAEVAWKIGVPADLLAAVIRTESAWNPDAVSSAGARGLMQLMPAAAEDAKVECKLTKVGDIGDADRNLLLGACYLRLAIRTAGGSYPGALAMYNGGYRQLDFLKSGHVLAGETAQYISLVLSRRDQCMEDL